MGRLLGREHDSTWVEAPPLLERSLSRLYYCYCCCFVAVTVAVEWSIILKEQLLLERLTLAEIVSLSFVGCCCWCCCWQLVGWLVGWFVGGLLVVCWCVGVGAMVFLVLRRFSDAGDVAP